MFHPSVSKPRGETFLTTQVSDMIMWKKLPGVKILPQLGCAIWNHEIMPSHPPSASTAFAPIPLSHLAADQSCVMPASPCLSHPQVRVPPCFGCRAAVRSLWRDGASLSRMQSTNRSSGWNMQHKWLQALSRFSERRAWSELGIEEHSRPPGVLRECLG